MIFQVAEQLLTEGAALRGRRRRLGLNIIHCFICTALGLLVTLTRSEPEAKEHTIFRNRALLPANFLRLIYSSLL